MYRFIKRLIFFKKDVDLTGCILGLIDMVCLLKLLILKNEPNKQKSTSVKSG